jgi:FkbM family methyltransferase
MKDMIKSGVRSLLKTGDPPLGNDKNDTSLSPQAAHFERTAKILDLLSDFSDQDILEALPNVEEARSQLGQDLFVLVQTHFKREGYFVEFGAADGLELSNSYLLEKSFGWRGIVAEPARVWQSGLIENRDCHIETACVWKNSASTLDFQEVEYAPLSTIEEYADSDYHAGARKRGKTYPVKTISLLDMLLKFDAPATIDYLSIDTEGSEFDILDSFDFTRYRFRVITCEHNFTAMRSKIYDLLTAKGYTRVFENRSDFDDWYIHQ